MTRGPSPVRPLVVAAGPLWILFSLVLLLLRHDGDRLQALPALLIGVGLLLQSSLGWRRRRRALLAALRDVRPGPGR